MQVVEEDPEMHLQQSSAMQLHPSPNVLSSDPSPKLLYVTPISSLIYLTRLS